MKITLPITWLFLFCAIGTMSCTECQVCTKDSEPEVRFCDDDYDSNTQYGLALDVAEASGYTCN